MPVRFYYFYRRKGDVMEDSMYLQSVVFISWSKPSDWPLNPVPVPVFVPVPVPVPVFVPVPTPVPVAVPLSEECFNNWFEDSSNPCVKSEELEETEEPGTKELELELEFFLSIAKSEEIENCGSRDGR